MARLNVDKRKQLNGYHVVFLIQNIMIGTGMLSLPQDLSSMGYSLALYPLLFGVVASLNLWPMIWICSQYKNENIFGINEKLLGKWIGKSFNLFIVVHLTFFIAGIIDDYMNLIQTTALPEQSTTIPILFFLVVAIYIVNGGIKSIARFCMMAFFLTLPLLYFLRWAIEKGDLSHLLPLFNFNKSEAFEAFRKGYLSILGYELIMVYFPYIANQKKAYKHALIGVWISIILCFVVTTVSVMYYSEWQLEHVTYSVLHLFKAGELTYIERIDIIGITIWVFLVLTTITGYLWCAKKGIDSFRSKKKISHVYVITIAIYIILSMPFSKEVKEKIFEAAFQTSYLMLCWPIFLIVVHLLRKKQVQS
ncbi:germination protein GerB [Psychrobacillus lasiicapitis]|nr:germination protein GerB [Psychrobacillus lasiicapitis]